MKQAYELSVRSLINPELHGSNVTVFYLPGQAEILLDKKEPNKNAKFSWKRNWMKSVLVLNIHLRNPKDVLNRKPEFKVSSWVCL